MFSRVDSGASRTSYAALVCALLLEFVKIDKKEDVLSTSDNESKVTKMKVLFCCMKTCGHLTS
jgi:hypothetical protein